MSHGTVAQSLKSCGKNKEEIKQRREKTKKRKHKEERKKRGRKYRTTVLSEDYVHKMTSWAIN
jgi:hypothetical protein